jgi:hypothetical protein
VLDLAILILQKIMETDTPNQHSILLQYKLKNVTVHK